MTRGISEQAWLGGFPSQRLHNVFERKREQRVLRAISNHLVGVTGEKNQNFGAVGGLQVGATGANGEFSLACGATVAQSIDKFGSESFQNACLVFCLLYSIG